MTLDVFSGTCKSNDFWVYKVFAQNRELFPKGIHWKVRNGKLIKFWYDIWCGQESILEMLHMKD